MKSYQEYWKTVRVRAKEKASKKLGIGGRILALVVASLSSFIVSFFLGGNMTTNVIAAVVTATVWLFVWATVFVWYKAHEPVVIFNEQASRIGRFFPETLDIFVYSELDTTEFINDKGKQIKSISFVVKNSDKKKKIVELDAEIKSISQTSIDPDSGETITLPFYAETRVIWDNKDIPVSLRPEQKMGFYIAYLDLEKESVVRFGEDRFTSWLFSREAIYQFSIEFIGKLEGENEFRRFNYMNVVYSNPTDKSLFVAIEARSRHKDIPESFFKIIDSAQKGYWYDYSSPFQRQQAQKRASA